jgi:urease accessory protein
MPFRTKYLWIAILSLVASETALAHTGEGITGGLMSGFMHPLAGLDHVSAMVAVGILGAFLGRPAIWVLPVVFPLVMAFGGVLGLLGIPIPYIEVGIAASSLVLGSMILFQIKPPLWITATIVAAFAIFHGHAHGTELPKAASALAYSVGFVVSTGLLHLAGIGFGELIRWPTGKIIARATGGIIALVGIGYLTGLI